MLKSRFFTKKTNFKFWQGYIGIAVFIIFNTIAMILYPGGTYLDSKTEGYHFFYNFLFIFVNYFVVVCYHVVFLFLNVGKTIWKIEIISLESTNYIEKV